MIKVLANTTTKYPFVYNDQQVGEASLSYKPFPKLLRPQCTITELNDLFTKVNITDYKNLSILSSICLHGFVIYEPFRGKGYSKMMLKNLLIQAPSVDFIWLTVSDRNTKAINCYSKEGFICLSNNLSFKVMLKKGKTYDF